VKYGYVRLKKDGWKMFIDKRRIFDVYSYGKGVGSNQRLYQREKSGFGGADYTVYGLIRTRFGNGSGRACKYR
jgi:hypothetical protein